MELNLILWILGTTFTFSIFAIKVGIGLGFGNPKKITVLLVLSSYLLLFVLIALLSEKLIKFLEPILIKGPYLHIFMAVGLIVWGKYLIKESKKACEFEKRGCFIHYSLPLLLPCPVCLSAMTFSTWALLSVIKLPAYLVGLSLGFGFISLSLLVLGLIKIKKSGFSPVSLGLSMVAIGGYFIGSLIVPAKIEEAKKVYQNFLAEGSNFSIKDNIYVLGLLFIALIIGYFSNKRLEVRK
jgi:predicted transporter